jgi:serine/threonine-protein kinase SRPK3
MSEFGVKYGEPDAVPIIRVDEKPLTPNVRARAVVHLHLDKKAQKFTLTNARSLVLNESETQDEIAAQQIIISGSR